MDDEFLDNKKLIIGRWSGDDWTNQKEEMEEWRLVFWENWNKRFKTDRSNGVFFSFIFIIILSVEWKTSRARWCGNAASEPWAKRRKERDSRSCREEEEKTNGPAVESSWQRDCTHGESAPVVRSPGSSSRCQLAWNYFFIFKENRITGRCLSSCWLPVVIFPIKRLRLTSTGVRLPTQEAGNKEAKKREKKKAVIDRSVDFNWFRWLVRWCVRASVACASSVSTRVLCIIYLSSFLFACTSVSPPPPSVGWVVLVFVYSFGKSFIFNLLSCELLLLVVVLSFLLSIFNEILFVSRYPSRFRSFFHRMRLVCSCSSVVAGRRQRRLPWCLVAHQWWYQSLSLQFEPKDKVLCSLALSHLLFELVRLPRASPLPSSQVPTDRRRLLLALVADGKPIHTTFWNRHPRGPIVSPIVLFSTLTKCDDYEQQNNKRQWRISFCTWKQMISCQCVNWINGILFRSQRQLNFFEAKLGI